METKGRFIDASVNYLSRKLRVTFELDDRPDVEGLTGRELTIIAKQYRQKRSLDANAYYWQLLTKLADKLGVSNACMHNSLLRQYGQVEIVDDKLIYLVLPDSEDGANKALEAETYHIRPTSETKEGSDGITYRTYVMLRGSSTYDTKEMSRLIDGLITECKEFGIDTMPPEELKRMMTMYEQKWSRKHENSSTG